MSFYNVAIITFSSIDQFVPILLTTDCGFAAALQSVFPQSELGTFMSLIKKDKEQQLNDLSMIVTGIRLFNKDSRKGGEGIDDCKFQNITFILFIYTLITETISQSSKCVFQFCPRLPYSASYSE